MSVEVNVDAGVGLIASSANVSLSQSDLAEGLELIQIGSEELKAQTTATWQRAYEQTARADFLSFGKPGSTIAMSAIEQIRGISGGALQNGLSEGNVRAMFAAGGAALGAFCGPGAPVCGAVFAIAASEIGAALFNWANKTKEKIAQAKRECREQVQANQFAWDDSVVAIRKEWISRLGTNLSEDQAWELLYQASREEQLRVPDIYQSCTQSAWACEDDPGGVQRDAQLCMQLLPEFHANVMAVLKNLEAEQAKTLLEERIKKEDALYDQLLKQGHAERDADLIAQKTIERYQARRAFLMREYDLEYDAADSIARSSSATDQFIESRERRKRNLTLIVLGASTAVLGGAGYAIWHKGKHGSYPSIPYPSIRTAGGWHAPRVKRT